MLIEVAKKRLTWLLTHINQINPSKPFDETDIELFYDYRLIEVFDKFDFSRTISASATFNQPWEQRVETFLDACRRKGLDSGKLLAEYQQRNHHVKEFILHQHQLNANKPSQPSMQPSSEPAVIKEGTHHVRL